MNKKMKFKKLMFIAASTLALGVAPAITMSCNFYIKSNPFLEYLKDKSENLSFYKKTPYWLQKNAKDKTSNQLELAYNFFAPHRAKVLRYDSNGAFPYLTSTRESTLYDSNFSEKGIFDNLSYTESQQVKKLEEFKNTKEYIKQHPGEVGKYLTKYFYQLTNKEAEDVFMYYFNNTQYGYYVLTNYYRMFNVENDFIYDGSEKPLKNISTISDGTNKRYFDIVNLYVLEHLGDFIKENKNLINENFEDFFIKFLNESKKYGLRISSKNDSLVAQEGMQNAFAPDYYLRNQDRKQEDLKDVALFYKNADLNPKGQIYKDFMKNPVEFIKKHPNVIKVDASETKINDRTNKNYTITVLNKIKSEINKIKNYGVNEETILRALFTILEFHGLKDYQLGFAYNKTTKNLEFYFEKLVNNKWKIFSLSNFFDNLRKKFDPTNPVDEEFTKDKLITYDAFPSDWTFDLPNTVTKDDVDKMSIYLENGVKELKFTLTKIKQYSNIK